MVIGGPVASTLITLLLIPVAYATATSWVVKARAARRRWGGDEAQGESAARQAYP